MKALVEKDRHIHKEKNSGQTTSGLELQLFPRSLLCQINLDFGLAYKLGMVGKRHSSTAQVRWAGGLECCFPSALTRCVLEHEGTLPLGYPTSWLRKPTFEPLLARWKELTSEFFRRA